MFSFGKPRPGSVVERNGRKLLIASNGTPDFGFIRKEISKVSKGRIPSKPIRVETGSAAYGADHIQADRHAKAQELGYADAHEMFEDVVKNYDGVIEQSPARSKDGKLRLMLVKRTDRNRYAIVELQEGDDAFYGMTTTFIEGRENSKKYTRTSMYKELVGHRGRWVWRKEDWE